MVKNFVLGFTVDGRPFTTHDQFLTGAQIKSMAGIPADHQLLLVIPQFEDELIDNEKTVNMARPGIERFIIRPPHHMQEIIVNGKHIPYPEKIISYEKVVELASGEHNPEHEYTVTYWDGDHRNPKGEMVPGDSVFVKDKMKFDVTGTHRA